MSIRMLVLRVLVTLSVILFAGINVSACAGESADDDIHLKYLALFEKPKLFKIGFEFEEQHCLCPSSENAFIFSVYKNERRLWQLKIEGGVFEFVTDPFSNFEFDLLDESLKTIEIAFDVLHQIKNTYFFPTFNEFIYGKPYVYDGFALFFGMSLEKQLRGLKERVEAEGCRFVLDKSEILNKPLHITLDWEPEFIPQVTIQHNLKSTISLISSLSCNKKNIDINTDAISFKINKVIEINESFFFKH